jgi:hypothetical protein
MLTFSQHRMRSSKSVNKIHEMIMEKGKSDGGVLLTKDQLIDFVNWLEMSDVVVREEEDGWFRIQFVETARKKSI